MFRDSDVMALKSDALRLGLRRIFTSDHFSICDLDKLLRIANVHPPAEIYDSLNAMHCVHYNTMSDGTKARVYAAVLSLFAIETFNLELIDHLADEVAYNQAGSPSVMRPALGDPAKLLDGIKR